MIRLRNPLFVPGGKPELLAKVARSAPDAVIVDLEDAVAPADKDAARKLVIEALGAGRPEVATVLVRINAVGTPWHDVDVLACADLIAAGVLDGVVLPKYERVPQLTGLRAALPGAVLVVGLETGLGVADARPLLAEQPDAAYFGAEDYAADLGARRTVAGAEVLFARSAVVLAAALAGVAALDQAVVAVHDLDAFRADAATGRDLGYAGKICLHPGQVAIAADVFTPTAAEVAHARAVLGAAEGGVGMVDGAMVDAVHATMARAVLARAGEMA